MVVLNLRVLKRTITKEQLVASIAAALRDEPILSTITSAVESVYRTHGLGYRDTTYRGLMAAHFTADRVRFEANPKVLIGTGDKNLGEATLNCLVREGAWVMMVRALPAQIRAADRAVMQSYLKLLGLRHGVIVSFGKEQLELRHVLYSR